LIGIFIGCSVWNVVFGWYSLNLPKCGSNEHFLRLRKAIRNINFLWNNSILGFQEQAFFDKTAS
jgi:hypothetical protein